MLSITACTVTGCYLTQAEVGRRIVAPTCALDVFADASHDHFRLHVSSRAVEVQIQSYSQPRKFTVPHHLLQNASECRNRSRSTNHDLVLDPNRRLAHSRRALPNRGQAPQRISTRRAHSSRAPLRHPQDSQPPTQHSATAAMSRATRSC